MRHLGRHAHRFAPDRASAGDGLADIHRIRAHLDDEADFADHVADDAASDNPVGFDFEDELGKALVGAVVMMRALPHCLLHNSSSIPGLNEG